MKSAGRPAIAALAVVLAATTLVVAAEASLRAFGFGDPVLYQRDEHAGYRPKPNQRHQRFRGATVTIDANGVRTVDDWTMKGATRLLFLGDSVTWGGTRIDDRETFVHLTGRDLERRLGGRIAAGNAGVNGYGTENIRARLLARTPEADILVIVLLPEDAIRGLVDLHRSYFFEYSPPGPLPALWEGTIQAAYWIGSLGIRPPRSTSRTSRVVRENLARLLAAVWVRQREGARVLLVLTPYRDDVFGRPSRLTRRVRRQLSASGLPFLDLTDAARSEADAPLYLDGVHLDRTGHALWAHAIADRLAPVVTDQRNAAAVPPEVCGQEADA